MFGADGKPLLCEPDENCCSGCEASWTFFVIDNVACIIQFTDTSPGNPTAWLWDFGDGSTSTQQNPLHQFPTGGDHTVRLTITVGSEECFEQQIVAGCCDDDCPTHGIMTLSNLATCTNNVGSNQCVIDWLLDNIEGQSFELSRQGCGVLCWSVGLPMPVPGPPCTGSIAYNSFRAIVCYDSSTGLWEMGSTASVAGQPFIHEIKIKKNIPGPDPCLGPGTINSDGGDSVNVISMCRARFGGPEIGGLMTFTW